jgi:hypothetical protein
MRTMRMKLTVLGLIALVTSISAALAPAAGAYSNPNYPGSTLSLEVSGPSVAGQITTIVASGTNTKEEIGGYQLDMYAKVASIDHTCANTSFEEKSTVINEPTESQIAIGLSEGFGPFSVPVKAMFNPGTIVLCAYSLWSYDTAVSATLSFTTSGGSGATPSAPSGTGGQPSKPPTGYTRAVAKCKKLYKGASKKKKRAKCIAAAKRHYHVK